MQRWHGLTPSIERRGVDDTTGRDRAIHDHGYFLGFTIFTERLPRNFSLAVASRALDCAHFCRRFEKRGVVARSSQVTLLGLCTQGVT
jgi:hypothetical protein